MNFDFEINRIIRFDKISSTQDIAKNIAETAGENCVLIQAETQTNGRGRYSRAWHSGAGGLYVSLLLRPKNRINSTAELSVKTGEAVAQTLQDYGVKTKIKLPNDVLAAVKGKYNKISGVLIETSSESDNIQWLAVGIGVNLNNKPSKNLQAASVKEITGREVDIKQFRDKLIENFAFKYLQWQACVRG
jgi:BirA family biotin operon repressor/biotin-[acetyl-CoA-carboxylase] ligase